MAPPVAWGLAVCLGAGLTLSGCGAGQITQTDAQLSAVTGASADGGAGIALRNVWMPYPTDPTGRYPVGSSVPVQATIANYGGADDELLAVTSPVATQVLVTGTTRIPRGRNVVSDTDPTPPPSPLVYGEVRVVLVTDRLLPTGLDTPVTFRFRNAGPVTVSVPMAG
ncbi:hypothetical protein [Pseudonocardia sp.]|uniref:hypothetical protein n=1 Tax=Pseudonocardia sp. TaxID=60912 RepID=UPI00261DC80C|nr:hypothetical protein [Pseudonocardia sp.]MCW2719307.1 hypothetical protein [Pseudonocardia sp.]